MLLPTVVDGSELLRVTLGNVRGDNVEYASPFSADNPGMWPGIQS